jgi:UDPglucose 6-dehydrogenase
MLMKLGIVGTGYVGLVTGVCLANIGNHVTCLDVNPEKIATMRQGKSPIYEPGLQELMTANIKAGRLNFTMDKNEAYRDADVIFICVGTPNDDHGNPDLRYVFGAADDVAAVLKELGPKQKRKIVVVKSTVPVGTTLAVRDHIRAKVGPEIPFTIGNNPEFLKQGAAVSDFLKPDRVVCGVEDEQAGEVFKDLYDPFVRNGHPVFTMDILSSEMVKYAANSFLATKISYINEIAMLCEAYGADINRVREGMCSDKRIGYDFLHPGLGFGGSCFPKDTLACVSMGEKAGHPALLIKAASDVNKNQRTHFFGKIKKHFESHGGLKGKTIGFWGLAFKPKTDDVREAPALDLIRMCLEAGASVRGYDPVGAANAKREVGEALTICAELYETVQGADAVVISTDWDEFKAPDFDRLGSIMRHKAIFDGRNLFRRQHVGEMGFHYYSVGRQAVHPA